MRVITGGDLTGSQRSQVVTPGPRMPLAARIRGAPHVVSVRAGGIDFDKPGEASLLQLMSQHGLGRRAAADVAHADHQDPVRPGECQSGRNRRSR